MADANSNLVRARPAPRCVVCAGPLLAHHAVEAQRSGNSFVSCAAVSCRMIVSRRSEMGEAGFKSYLRIQAAQTQGRLALAELLRAKSLHEAQENASAWGRMQAMQAMRANASPNALPALPLLIPSGPSRAKKLTQQRRQSYRAHLATIIDEALIASAPEPQTEPAAPPPTSPLESALPGRLCAFCGGGCCTRGGEQAYLTAATLRRVMAARVVQGEPTEPSELIEAYMAKLPAKAQIGSCINHGPQGCGLSRDMRSDVCNNYACEALAQLQQAQGQAQPVVVLALRRSQDNWRRAGLWGDNAINAGAVLGEQEEGNQRRLTPKALGLQPSPKQA